MASKKCEGCGQRARLTYGVCVRCGWLRAAIYHDREATESRRLAAIARRMARGEAARA